MKLAYLLLFAAPAVFSADLGGVVLGGRANAGILANLGIDAGTQTHVEQGRYRGTKRFELVDTKTAVEINDDGLVTQIYADFDTMLVDSMRDMGLRKWGKPVDSGVAVMPDGNLEKIWIWDTRDGAEITLESYDVSIPHGTMTRGSITMITKAAAEAKRGPRGNSL